MPLKIQSRWATFLSPHQYMCNPDRLQQAHHTPRLKKHWCRLWLNHKRRRYKMDRDSLDICLSFLSPPYSYNYRDLHNVVHLIPSFPLSLSVATLWWCDLILQTTPWPGFAMVLLHCRYGFLYVSPSLTHVPQTLAFISVGWFEFCGSQVLETPSLHFSSLLLLISPTFHILGPGPSSPLYIYWPFRALTIQHLLLPSTFAFLLTLFLPLPKL